MEIGKGSIRRVCETLPNKLNVDMLREMLPGIPHIIYGVLLECDNIPLVDYCMSGPEKILSKKNVTAVVATSVVLSVASLVLSAVWPTYGRWAPLLRTALVVLAVSITAVSLKKSFLRIKLPAH